MTTLSLVPCSLILNWGFRRFERLRKDRGAAPCCMMPLEKKIVGNGITYLSKGKSSDKKEAVGKRSNKV